MTTTTLRPRRKTRSRKRLRFASEEEINHVDRSSWSAVDLAQLDELVAKDATLPDDSPTALLSIRLSVFTDDTTSPQRQELDLRQRAWERRMKVVGVASDLNVRATKVPPWERFYLGAWINDRAPMFDNLMIWKLDRFIRNVDDLNDMMRWCSDHKKNMISLNDPLDLEGDWGRIIVQIIGTVAQIESNNTSLRVASMWANAKQQKHWITGRPPYGYIIHTHDNDGKEGKCTCGLVAKLGEKTLQIDESAEAALRYAYDQLTVTDVSLSALCRELTEGGLMEKTSVTTLRRRLRSPGILGYRVETLDPNDETPNSQKVRAVLNDKGDPVVVGPPIFTNEEFAELQAALDKRDITKTPRRPGGTTPFLGVVKCKDCGRNLVVQRRHVDKYNYAYLRCMGDGMCKGGGVGVLPEKVYEMLTNTLMQEFGDTQVILREYAQGAEARERAKKLEADIAYYMEGMKPGGRFTRTQFSLENAEKQFDSLQEELAAIEPESLKDRWIYTSLGMTYRERWEQGGYPVLAEDLERIGLIAVVERRKKGSGSFFTMEIQTPKDIEKALPLRENAFSRPV